MTEFSPEHAAMAPDEAPAQARSAIVVATSSGLHGDEQATQA